MQQKNSGKGEANILQNQFTKYLLKSILCDKARYLKKRSGIEYQESVQEMDTIRLPDDTISQIVDIVALEQALADLSRRDRYIFLARVLDKRGFEELAGELDMGYKAAFLHRDWKNFYGCNGCVFTSDRV